MTTSEAPPDTVPEASADPVSPTDIGGRGLTGRQAKVLLRLLRVAYPHPSFPDAPYERTAKTVEDAARTGDVLADGLDDLDARADGDFCALDEDRATAVVAEVAQTPFFALVHSTTVVALYDDHEVWDLLGYEGPSYDKGGYLHRGFDDLDWLPDPRIEEFDGPPRVELVDASGSGAGERSGS